MSMSLNQNQLDPNSESKSPPPPPPMASNCKSPKMGLIRRFAAVYSPEKKTFVFRGSRKNLVPTDTPTLQQQSSRQSILALSLSSAPNTAKMFTKYTKRKRKTSVTPRSSKTRQTGLKKQRGITARSVAAFQSCHSSDDDEEQQVSTNVKASSNLLNFYQLVSRTDQRCLFSCTNRPLGCPKGIVMELQALNLCYPQLPSPLTIVEKTDNELMSSPFVSISGDYKMWSASQRSLSEELYPGSTTTIDAVEVDDSESGSSENDGAPGNSTPGRNLISLLSDSSPLSCKPSNKIVLVDDNAGPDDENLIPSSQGPGETTVLKLSSSPSATNDVELIVSSPKRYSDVLEISDSQGEDSDSELEILPGSFTGASRRIPSPPLVASPGNSTSTSCLQIRRYSTDSTLSSTGVTAASPSITPKRSRRKSSSAQKTNEKAPSPNFEKMKVAELNEQIKLWGFKPVKGKKQDKIDFLREKQAAMESIDSHPPSSVTTTAAAILRATQETEPELFLRISEFIKENHPMDPVPDDDRDTTTKGDRWWDAILEYRPISLAQLDSALRRHGIIANSAQLRKWCDDTGTCTRGEWQ